MRLYAPPHNEWRYAEADRRSQSDCPYREPHLDIEPHLAILPERPATPVKANKHRCDGTSGCALQQTLQRFSLQHWRYLHGISFRPTCFGAKPRTPWWVPVQQVDNEDRTLCDGVSISVTVTPLSVRSLSKIAHIYRLIVTGSLAIVTLCSVTASFMTCYLRRKTTEAPAISTRPGLPTYRAWTVGGRSQRGPLLSCGPNALYQGPPTLRNKYDYQWKWGLASCLKAILTASPTGELTA